MNPAIFDRPSGAGALLGVGDIATPTAGYSLRYLSIKYFGQPVVRVRKDVVGSPEQDFTPSQLTDGTLATFLGANEALYQNGTISSVRMMRYKQRQPNSRRYGILPQDL